MARRPVKGHHPFVDLVEVFPTELVLIDFSTTRRSLAEELRRSGPTDHGPAGTSIRDC